MTHSLSLSFCSFSFSKSGDANFWLGGGRRTFLRLPFRAFPARTGTDDFNVLKQRYIFDCISGHANLTFFMRMSIYRRVLLNWQQVKVAFHTPSGAPHNLTSHPSQLLRTVLESEIEDMRAALALRLPGLNNKLLRTETCMYTCTPDGHL